MTTKQQGEILVVKEDHDYDAGFRDGRIKSLEKTVEILSRDVDILNKAVYLLYGAIAIVQFILPMLETANAVVK